MAKARKKRGFKLFILLTCFILVLVSIKVEEKGKRKEELEKEKEKIEEMRKEMIRKELWDLNEPSPENKKKPVKVERELSLTDYVAQMIGGSTAFVLE